MALRKTAQELVLEAKSRVENLSVEQVRAELAGGEVQLIDIREIAELERDGFIPGSIHVPRGVLKFWLDPASPFHKSAVDPERRMILY